MRTRAVIFGLVMGMVAARSPLPGQTGTPTPTGTSPSGAPTVAPGLLNYSVSASDSIITGYSGYDGLGNSVNISGNAGFVSGSENHPTSFVYSGGYLFGNHGQPSTSFQSFGVSQVLNTRKWTFVVSDSLSYLPATPRYGLAGVPGVGDVGSQPIAVGPLVGDALLTNYGQRITNTATGSAAYRFTARTDINAFAGYTNQHFFSNTGYNNNSLSAGLQLDHHLTAATTIGGAYTYTHASYPDISNFSFSSNGVLATYQHTFSPRLTMQASVGPQWTSGSNGGYFPTRVSVAANLGVNYVAGRNNYSLNYGRGTSTGSGVLLGALQDYVNFSGQRNFSDRWSAGVFASYGHVQSLANIASLYTSGNSFTAGLQGNRRLGEHWSAFGSYALQYQTVSQLQVTNNAFNGTAHVISFGITYAPRPIRLGRR